jgi:AcrR family transcriptional regulator
MATTDTSSETSLRILDAALELFRREGFEETTMRAIAAKAEVATGAAYYYFPSKEAIVMAFYRRSCDEMQPVIRESLQKVSGLENLLYELILAKIKSFKPNRGVLRALLKNGADPKQPVSPFSSETKEIREIDIAWFQQILDDSGVRIPKDLQPHMPEILWLFQMGIIFFWVTDDSSGQARTQRLLKLAVRIVARLVRLSGLPFMRPVRKTVVELVEIVKGG